MFLTPGDIVVSTINTRLMLLKNDCLFTYAPAGTFKLGETGLVIKTLGTDCRMLYIVCMDGCGWVPTSTIKLI